MKKILSFIIVPLFLVSCGSKPNLDNIIVTPETPITDNSQSAKVCEPVIKYLECSLASETEVSKKKGYEIAIKNLQREIDHDEPVTVAQKCDSMVRILVGKASQLPQNGCTIKPVYDISAEKAAPPITITPPTEGGRQ
jgi:hypothetical protein